MTSTVSPTPSTAPSQAATHQASPTASAPTQQNGSVDFDGLVVQTPWTYNSSGTGDAPANGTSGFASNIRGLPIYTNTRTDAAALVVVEYHVLDDQGNRLPITVQRTMKGEGGLLIPAGATDFLDLVEIEGDRVATPVFETTVKSVTWLPAKVDGSYARLTRTPPYDDTCINGSKIGCEFTNPNPYPVSAIPAGVLCYSYPSAPSECWYQEWLWEGQPTTIGAGESAMLTLTRRQADDLIALWDSLPPEQDGATLGWLVRYWLPADQPNWPEP